METVILFPAIDLKDGQAVRLKLGDMAQATVFNTDPAAQARTFETQGFRYLHVVDLNGAFVGESRNGDAVEAILRAVKMPEDIELIRHACELTGRGFHRLLKFVKPGVNETEVEAELAHEFIRGGGGFAYTPIIASGANACAPANVPRWSSR